MRAQLDELTDAAKRYASFQEAAAAPEGQATQAERDALSKRHAELFTLPSEKLRNLSASAALPPTDDAAAVAVAAVEAGAPIPPPLAIDVASREVMFIDNDLRPIRYLQVALLASRSVGKITVRDLGSEGDATGFLVAPGLLLTNWHVLKTRAHADASFVAFDYEDGLDGRPKASQTFALLPSRLFVADEALDYAFVAVAPRTAERQPLQAFGYLRLFEQTGKLDPNQRQAANIIQHANGRPKQIALRDNYFEEAPKDSIDPLRKQNSLFYGTDTAGGSSGSPVCSDDWYVVALHRGGVPRIDVVDGVPRVMRRDGTIAREGDPESIIAYVSNEGTRVSRIYASLRDKVAAGGEDSEHAAFALEQISAVSTDPRLGPIEATTGPLLLPRLEEAGAGAIQEILQRRAVDLYDGATGYKRGFLGRNHPIELPRMSAEVRREAAKLLGSDEVVLKYDHFSVVMHGARRTAIFVAGNIDGRWLWQNTTGGARPDRPKWSLDLRMDEAFQPDDTIFSQAMQRGHLYKREDVWAKADKFTRADQHSFTITNATPMIAAFNNVEWGDHEDLITRHLEEGKKVSFFAGPIFGIDDRYFNQLRAGVPRAQRRKGMRVPSAFWKVVAWVEDGELKAAGFVMKQTDEIREHGLIEEIDFGSYKQTPIDEIQDRTGLRFGLVSVDTWGE